MRKGATGWVAKILFGLLIISFGAWGIVDYLKPDPDPVVIQVGDSGVRQSTLRSQFNFSLERLRQRLGSTVTQEMALNMGLDDQVIDGVVDVQVLNREAEHMGMATNEDMLRTAIAQEPAFRGVTGTFDRNRYEQVLFSSGMSEPQFLADVQSRLLRDPLLAAAVAEPPVPKPMLDTQYAFFAQQRSLTLLSKEHTGFVAPADPGDGPLRAFYDGTGKAYNLPELRDISAIILSPEAIAKNFAVPEERIAEAYEARIAQYQHPEERTISQLLFTDADAAAKAVARLRNGESWVSVAADSGGVATELGSLTKAGMVPTQLAGPAFALTAAGFTDPIQTPFGYHVLWVKAIDPASTTPLAEVHDELRHAVALDLAVDELIKRANTVEDSIAGGGTLEDAANAVDMPVQTFKGVSRTGQTADGSRPDGLPKGGQFLALAYQTDDGETSVLTETPDGGYFVLRVDRVIASAKQPFATIRDKVLSDWTERQRAEAAKTAADKLAEAVRAGGDIGAEAKTAGFAETTLTAVTRTQTPAPATPELVDAAFKAKKGEVIVVNGPDRVFVARIDDVTVPKPGDDDKTAEQAMTQLRQILNRDRRQEIARAFQQAVRANYDVDIDKAAIDRALR
ncbi:MAG: SurA N-terminal domain-containing protein [Alphaproteobacteria bacterium]|nr:SurA N-terminal domain-containing protein [Alphaproteobacteria bacterium]